MEEEVSNNGGPWRARMNSRAPRQKEKKKMGDPIAKQHDSVVPADQMPQIRNLEQKLQMTHPMRNQQPPDRLIYTKW